jgi:hypothetical protein
LDIDHISSISDYGVIEGTGNQIIEFFLSFSYLDTQVPRSSDDWQLYLSLRNIQTDKDKLDIFAKKLIFFK